MPPTISVLLPYYNDEQFLAQSVASVLAQTYTDFELVLVNHACTDKSRSIARSFDDARVVHVDLAQNMGAGGGIILEAFLRVARGQFVKLFCADDIMLPDCLAVEMDFLAQNPAVDFCFADAAYIDAHGKPTGENFSTSFSKELFAAADAGFFVLNEYFSTIRNSVPFSTLFFRAPCFAKFRNDYTFVMKFDVQLILELLLADKALGRIPRVLAQYRIHEGQISSTNNAVTVYTYSFFESIPYYSTFLTTQNIKIMQKLLLTKEDDIEALHVIAALHFLRSPAVQQHISGYLYIHDVLNTEKGRALLQDKFGFSIADFRAMVRSNTYIHRLVNNGIDNLGIKGTTKALAKKIKRKVFKEKLDHS